MGSAHQPGAGVLTIGRGRTGLALLGALLSTVPVAAQSAPVVLDGLVATVGSRPIMLSDVRVARALGFVDDAAADEAVVTTLVNRALMLAEIERFQPPDPPEAAIAAGLHDVRVRVGDAAWAAALAASGVTEDYVRAFVRNSLRLDIYQRQRFDTLADPSEDEVRGEFEERRAAGTLGGVLLEDVRPRLREDLRAARFQALVDQWLTELRARSEVSVRPLPRRVAPRRRAAARCPRRRRRRMCPA
jgi:hypothetical protein